MRTPNTPRPNDFDIPIEGVGTFRFNRRTYGGQVKIDIEYARVTGGVDVIDPVVIAHANVISRYNALMVSCPPGWENLEAIDLTERPELENKILELSFALGAKLDSFRVSPSTQESSQGQSAGDVRHDGVLVSTPVQPDAERSPVP